MKSLAQKVQELETTGKLLVPYNKANILIIKLTQPKHKPITETQDGDNTILTTWWRQLSDEYHALVDNLSEEHHKIVKSWYRRLK